MDNDGWRDVSGGDWTDHAVPLGAYGDAARAAGTGDAIGGGGRTCFGSCVRSRSVGTLGCRTGTDRFCALRSSSGCHGRARQQWRSLMLHEDEAGSVT